jgi:hypothetical protein
MEPATLEHHMMVALNEPETMQIDEFKFQESISSWKEKKPRRLTLIKKKNNSNNNNS